MQCLKRRPNGDKCPTVAAEDRDMIRHLIEPEDDGGHGMAPLDATHKVREWVQSTGGLPANQSEANGRASTVGTGKIKTEPKAGQPAKSSACKRTDGTHPPSCYYGDKARAARAAARDENALHTFARGDTAKKAKKVQPANAVKARQAPGRPDRSHHRRPPLESTDPVRAVQDLMNARAEKVKELKEIDAVIDRAKAMLQGENGKAAKPKRGAA